MKKFSLLFVAALALLAPQAAQAQTDQNLFNHLGVGVSAGTDGIGFELATPITDFVALRAGMSFLPKVKYSGDVDIDSNSSSFTTKEVNVEGKLNKTDVKILLDIYPIPKASFRITAGAFIGAEKLINVYNTEQFLAPSEWGVSGIRLGDYRVTSDKNGNVSADVKVNSFKPYLGLGFGRAVPKKRLSFNVDLGVQFWGKPGIWTNAKDDWMEGEEATYHQLKKGDIDNDDADKAFNIISKITVWPVISFRLNGRIF
ncbi:MAG: hypothetical protein IJ841_09170 [Prevotella sp.]|nr:hypothetical protein [Prevotella sp.]